MNRTVLEELREGNLSRMMRAIQNRYEKGMPEIDTVLEDVQLLKNISNVTCELVAQGAKAAATNMGWEGLISGSDLMEGIVNMHDLKDKTTLLHYTHALLLIAAILLSED